jgi:hypothetical protein
MLTSEEGGRKSPIFSGYICDCRVPAGEGHQLTAGAIWLGAAESLAPGETGSAWIQPGSPERWREVVVGTEVGLCEGPVLVGVASVLEVRPIPQEARLFPSHRRSTHRRWVTHLNRRMGEDGYQEEWRREQCGLCQYWIPLAGSWGLDRGVCSNEASSFDGMARFEHDGCEAYEEAPEWRGPQDFADEEIR